MARHTTTRPAMPSATTICLLAAVLGLALRLPPVRAADPDEQVAEFLDRLGLTALEIAHLEQALQGPQAPDKQTRFARRLADLYALRLMEVSAGEEESRAILQRIGTLFGRFPQANTPALQVMLLQADYNRAESLAVQWIANAADVEARSQATELLQRIAPPLNEFEQALSAQVDQLVDALGATAEGEARAVQEKELARLQAVAGRAAYFAGWSNYYLGLTRGSAGRGEAEAARRVFRKLLEIRDDDLRGLDADLLGLESAWRCRAVIGLGLTEAYLGNLESSRTCFALLEHASVPPEIQDQAAYWYLQGLLNAGRYPDARKYAGETVAGYEGQASQGKVSLCVALVRAAYADRSGAVPPEKSGLGTLGLEGLARLGQHRLIEQLTKQYQITLDSSGNFFLAWVEGRGLLAVADARQQPEAYQAAADKLTAALAAPAAERHVRSAAQCRYELAWCNYQLGRFEQAARLYDQAATGLRAAGSAAAADAAWMVFACYQKLCKQAPQHAQAAADALRRIARDFPNHPHAKRVDYYLKKLRDDTGRPEHLIARLEQIPPGDVSYLAAQYDLCDLWHEVWSQQDAAGKAAARSKLLAAVDRCLETSRQAPDETRQLKAALLAAEVLLADPAGDASAAAGYLQRASAWASRVPDEHPLAADYHYRRLVLAGRQADDAARRTHARWLLEHAPESAYEVPALVVVAKSLEEQIQADTAAPDAQRDQEAWDVYHRLSERLGTEPETLRAAPNARVALSKAAEYAGRRNRPDEAAAYLEKLLAAFPTDKNYLRRAGLARFETSEYAQSLAHWRTLLGGLPDGTDAWYEAKYYQLRCLMQTDPALGQKVFRQLQLLHPDFGSPAWREKFQEFLK